MGQFSKARGPMYPKHTLLPLFWRIMDTSAALKGGNTHNRLTDMDWLENFYTFVRLMPVPLALVAVLTMYFVFKKKDELSRHAAQNTAATLVIYGLNLFVALSYVKEINHFFQTVYASLHIPTVNPQIWDNVPLWIICIVGIVAVDFADYWNHRLMHTKWGWPTHAAHHSDTHVNAFTGFRVHFLEAIVMTTSYIVMLTWLQIPQALPFAAAFAALHNMYVHMNLPYTHGPFKYLLASPVFHRWHHADVPEAYGKNLANKMPIWDKLFGTYIDPGQCHEAMGALNTGVEDKNPILIYVYPFREWARLVQKTFSPAPKMDDKSTDGRVTPAE